MMRIALRHRARLMTEKPLHLVQIDSPLYEPRGERMAHIVETKVWNSGSIASLAELSHQISHLELIPERRLEDQAS